MYMYHNGKHCLYTSKHKAYLLFIKIKITVYIIFQHNFVLLHLYAMPVLVRLSYFRIARGFRGGWWRGGVEDLINLFSYTTSHEKFWKVVF